MKSFSKTPYELRFDLLQLAFDILRYKADQIKNTAPSTEEVIAEAEKMNVFISKANQHQ